MGEPKIRMKDYLFAEKNGISKGRLQQRVYVLGWSVERAVTMPIRKTDSLEWQKWEGVAIENKVSYYTYRNRVLSGWEKERAAKTPPAKRNWKTNPIWQEWREKAEQHGVGRDVFNHRTRKLGWNYERAATTTPGKLCHPVWEEWKEVAKQHDVRKETFWVRVRKNGMSYEEAATKPPAKRRNRKN